jgi:integrase
VKKKEFGNMIVERESKTRKGKIYYVRLIDENGKKRLYSPGHTSKKVAEQYEWKLKNEIAERKMFPEKFFERRKLSDFVPEYLRKHAAHTRSYDFYAVMCKKLVSYFGEMYLDEITRYHVESYQSERAEQVSVYTVNRELTILKGICTKAIDWGFLIKNPVKGVKLGKEKARERFLFPEEIGKLIESCGKERMASYLKSVVIIALYTGLRKKELLNLKREHIYMDRDKIWIEEGKGGYSRPVDLYPTAKREIAKLLLKGKSEYLIHDKEGKPYRDIKKSFNSAVKRAGLQDVHFHDLRRTFATIGALYARIDEKAMQKVLGHASIETTMKHYVMSTEEHEKEGIQRLGGILDTYMDTSKKEAIKKMA